MPALVQAPLQESDVASICLQSEGILDHVEAAACLDHANVPGTLLQEKRIQNHWIDAGQSNWVCRFRCESAHQNCKCAQGLVPVGYGSFLVVLKVQEYRLWPFQARLLQEG